MLQSFAQTIECVTQQTLILFIRIYRLLFAPILGGHCRFYPSCSHYTEQAIVLHGPVKGSLLGVKRILRCNPFHPTGVDFVPEKKVTIT